MILRPLWKVAVNRNTFYGRFVDDTYPISQVGLSGLRALILHCSDGEMKRKVRPKLHYVICLHARRCGASFSRSHRCMHTDDTIANYSQERKEVIPSCAKTTERDSGSGEHFHFSPVRVSS